MDEIPSDTQAAMNFIIDECSHALSGGSIHLGWIPFVTVSQIYAIVQDKTQADFEMVGDRWRK
jgi:hypothetical protein